MVHIPLNIYIRGESRTVGMSRHFNETVGSTEAHSAHRIGVGAGGDPEIFEKIRTYLRYFQVQIYSN